MATPTMIGLPDPPSNPDTPTEAPGTPNSTTTSLSALSTTAIKDGHRGSVHPSGGQTQHHSHSSNTLEAERADRISRLAGLERVATVRPQNSNSVGMTGSAAAPLPGYFDLNGNPVYATKVSTVGTASATGSFAGRTTTWASSSMRGQTEADDEDQMSMDTNYRDSDHFSASAMDDDPDDDATSDDTSLVGFGEGASSTVSGPTYNRNNLVPKSNSFQQVSTTGSAVAGSGIHAAEQPRFDAKPVNKSEVDSPDSGHTEKSVGSNSRHEPARQSGSLKVLSDAHKNVADIEEAGIKKLPLSNPDETGLGTFYFEK